LVIVLNFCWQIPGQVWADEEIGLKGIVTNRVITRQGHEFYREFTSRWIPPQNVGDPNVLITEKVNPQWGSVILVSVDGQLVFRSQISRRGDGMEESVKKAVKAALLYVVRREFVSGKENPDLQGDGLR
jgi:curli production assembly/transport component CsgE